MEARARDLHSYLDKMEKKWGYDPLAKNTWTGEARERKIARKKLDIIMNSSGFEDREWFRSVMCDPDKKQRTNNLLYFLTYRELNMSIVNRRLTKRASV